MGLFITNRKYKSADFYNADGGLEFLNARPGDRMIATIDFYVKWSAEEKRLTFVAGTKTIELSNTLDRDTFVSLGFREDDTFDVTDTASNDGSYTIASISEDGRTITTVEALVNETAESGNLFGTTPITALNFFYSIQKSGDQVNYESSVDRGTDQWFRAEDLDATDTGDTNMRSGPKSTSWIVVSMLNIATGETDQVTVAGAGISDYKQAFTITQNFVVTPFWKRSLQSALSNGTIPDEFSVGLGYNCSIEALYDSNSPDIPHSGGEEGIKKFRTNIGVYNASDNGIATWYDQGPGGKRPEYTIDSILLYDYTTQEEITTLDAGRDAYVYINIRSASGRFYSGAGPGTKFNAFIMDCSVDEATYVGLDDATMLQNMLTDRALNTIGGADAPGINFGTAYQRISSFQCFYNDTETCTLLLIISNSSEVKATLKSRDALNRNFAIVVATEAYATASSASSDRVQCVVDFDNAEYDEDDDTLLEVVSVQVFKTQDLARTDQHALVGYEGEPCYVEVRFLLNSAEEDGVTPTMQSLGLEIVAEKTDAEDFVLESFVSDTSQIRKLLGVQQLAIDTTRGFVTAFDDPTNLVTLVRDATLDDGDMLGYKLSYGLILRYEDWREALPAQEGAELDIFHDITDVTQRWANYNDVEGWSLALRFSATVRGYDGHDTEFTMDTPVAVFGGDEAPEAGPTLACALEFFIATTEWQSITIAKDYHDATAVMLKINGVNILTAAVAFSWGNPAQDLEDDINAAIDPKYSVTVEDGAVANQYIITLASADGLHSEDQATAVADPVDDFFTSGFALQYASVDSIQVAGTTRIRATFTGDVESSVAGSVATSAVDVAPPVPGTPSTFIWYLQTENYPTEPTAQTWNQADAPGAQAQFQAYLDIYFPGFTCVVTFSGGQWHFTVTTPETERFNGIVPSYGLSVGMLGVAGFAPAFAGGVTPIEGVYGALFSDTDPAGSIFTRRFASSEYASEDDSPWSDPGAITDADISRCDGNVRISVYEGTQAIVEGLFDSTVYGPTQETIRIYPLLGFNSEPHS